MTSRLLEHGLKWHRDALQEAAAVTVEVRAAPDAIIEQLDAVPGRRDFQGWSVEEASGTTEVFDWIVAANELMFPLKGKLEPADGWEIRYRTEGGRTMVFVVRPQEGTRAFDVSDWLGLLYRIHTKFDRFE